VNDIDISTEALKHVHISISEAYKHFTAAGDAGIEVLNRKQVQDVASAVGGLGDSGTAIRDFNNKVAQSVARFITSAINEFHTIEKSLESTIEKVDEHESTRKGDAKKVSATGGQG
jgi:hypothetical protein